MKKYATPLLLATVAELDKDLKKIAEAVEVNKMAPALRRGGSATNVGA